MKIGLPFLYHCFITKTRGKKSGNPEFLVDAVNNLITEMEVDKFLSFHYSSSRIDLLWLWRRTEICYGVLFSSFVDLAGDDYSTRVQRFQIEKTMAVFLTLNLYQHCVPKSVLFENSIQIRKKVVLRIWNFFWRRKNSFNFFLAVFIS